jgi:endogenous inhibitor of DNA gyrase (YacG/DUF329 family)
MIDLGAWFSERHAIAGESADDDANTRPTDAESEE